MTRKLKIRKLLNQLESMEEELNNWYDTEMEDTNNYTLADAISRIQSSKASLEDLLAKYSTSTKQSNKIMNMSPEMFEFLRIIAIMVVSCGLLIAGVFIF